MHMKGVTKMVKKYLETLYGMGEKALQALIIIVIGYIVYKIFDKLLKYHF